ncbi:MAG: RDD family protein [Terracidiphilus sp.]
MSQPSPEPSWKQEVNQRLAAHKTRKGLSVVAQPTPTEVQSQASSLAAKAAARVAARYAHAPSYSEMQAAEARAALRAAEVATRAALEAQAAAQVALDNLQTTDDVAFAGEEVLHRREAEYSTRPAEEADVPSSSSDAASSRPLEIPWESDMPELPAVNYPAAAGSEHEEFESMHEDRRVATDRTGDSAVHEPVEAVKPAQPFYANLIHFPREIIATRRIRPRIAEHQAVTGDEQTGQLSIFEVDPSTVSTEATAPGASAGSSARSWIGPEWSDIQLDAQPEADTDVEAEPAAMAPTLYLAPFGLRLMAAAVDTALVVGFVCACAAVLANSMTYPPALKTAELGAIVTLFFAGALYQFLFIMLAQATPGMKYARISLCTFDDECPSREQLRSRLVAMLLSLLPVCLGVAWAIFDDDHLTWHDRLSRTYLRRN